MACADESEKKSERLDFGGDMGGNRVYYHPSRGRISGSALESKAVGCLSKRRTRRYSGAPVLWWFPVLDSPLWRPLSFIVGRQKPAFMHTTGVAT